MVTFALAVIALLMIGLMLMKVSMRIRYSSSIKWIASGYVIILIICAVMAARQTPTVQDASPARLAAAKAHNAQLMDAFEKGTNNLPPEKTWTQRIDETAPVILQADILSYYRVVENESLHNQIRVELFTNDAITDNIDYKEVLRAVHIEKGDQGFDITYPHPLTVNVLTDRLFFVSGQHRAFGEVSDYEPGSVYVRVEVPTGVTVQAPGNFSQFE